nr:HAD hydrolase-like protein [Ligilactobacillus salitolerans]
MDGLLLDTETLYYETRKEVLAQYGFPFEKSDHAQYVARGFADTIEKLQQLVGDKQLGQVVFEKAMKLYQQRITASQVQLKKGTRELLTYLNDQGKNAM